MSESGIVTSHAKPMRMKSGLKLGPQARMGVKSIVLLAFGNDRVFSFEKENYGLQKKYEWQAMGDCFTEVRRKVENH